MKRRHSVSRLSLPLSVGLSAALMASVGLVVGACSGLSVESDCEESKTCAVGPGDGGGGGNEGGFDVVAPPGCDLTKSPKESAACVDDAVGVFVSASGDDGATGAKASPVKSVARGVEIAASKGLPRVYVCEGSYDKAVEIKAPVSLYGGFACAGWTYSGAKPKLQPSAGKDYALDISASNVTIVDFEVLGPETGAPNSIAVRAVNASGLVFERVTLKGRAGANGANGTRTDFAGFPSQADLNGNDASGAAVGGTKEYTCPGGAKTTGGKGGASGFDGDPGLPALGGGAGGTVSQCQMTGQGGFPGAAGAAVSAADGAKATGALVSNAWAPQSGATGANGGPGQGGGGGGAVAGGFGGGGAAGGCGGAGGGGGSGGGASVALLSINSAVTLRASDVTTGKAGNGGEGMAGQSGQSIFGFGGSKSGGGCNGGNGGSGASGGAGGGGAGGISVGILYKGAEPTKDGATTITPGTAGDPGKGPASNDGIAGTSAPMTKLE